MRGGSFTIDDDEWSCKVDIEQMNENDQSMVMDQSMELKEIFRVNEN